MSRVAFSTNATRSSALNSVLPLRTGRLTTATITLSNIAEAREITSRWPKVTGSYEPGQTAMRLSGAMDSDQCVAVTALIEQRQFQVQRGASVALGDDSGVRCEHRR